MGLAEILRQRTADQNRTADVNCGKLGMVTVEALPLREVELLYRGGDGARALFFAACRELQAAGEALRQAGKLYTPDGVLQFVSQEEAETAAQAILRLSGYAPETAAAPEAAEAPDAAAVSAGNTVGAAAAPWATDDTHPPKEQPLEPAASHPEQPSPETSRPDVSAVAAHPQKAADEGLPARKPMPSSGSRKPNAAFPPATQPTSAAEPPPQGAAIPEDTSAAVSQASHQRQAMALNDPADLSPTGAEVSPAKSAAAAIPTGEALARQLLEGLRLASWMRGD